MFLHLRVLCDALSSVQHGADGSNLYKYKRKSVCIYVCNHLCTCSLQSYEIQQEKSVVILYDSFNHRVFKFLIISSFSSFFNRHSKGEDYTVCLYVFFLMFIHRYFFEECSDFDNFFLLERFHLHGGPVLKNFLICMW